MWEAAMRRATRRSPSLARRAIAGAFAVFLATSTACASNAAPGSVPLPSPSRSLPSGGMTTSSPTGTPAGTAILSPSVRPDLAHRANAIALEWVHSIGLPEPDIVWDMPADPGLMVAIKLKFPRQVVFPPGIPMNKSLGEEGSQGSTIVPTTEPKYGTTAFIVVDLAAQRLHAVVYIGPYRGSPPP
jgi:hypothetical protein